MREPQKKPSAERIARWVENYAARPDVGRTGEAARKARRRAATAGEALARHGLGPNGQPAGKVAP